MRGITKGKAPTANGVRFWALCIDADCKLADDPNAKPAERFETRSSQAALDRWVELHSAWYHTGFGCVGRYANNSVAKTVPPRVREKL